MKLPTGPCAICGRSLGIEDYRQGSVIALIGPEGNVLCCASHAVDEKQYAETIQKLARLKANQITARDN